MYKMRSLIEMKGQEDRYYRKPVKAHATTESQWRRSLLVYA